jgi:type VI secretion system protein ImpJ
MRNINIFRRYNFMLTYKSTPRRSENPMNMPLKVLWSEGLTLGPQQFQQQDMYHEARLHLMAKTIEAHLWGINKIEWRIEDLANNLLRADSMSLIFADGEIYDAPASEQLPSQVDLSKLPTTETEFTFHAALPMLKPYGGNFSATIGHHDDARYAQARADTPDLFSEAIATDVAYLKKTVRLLSGSESLDAYEHFPVIKIRRMAGGGFEIDRTFVPPCLSIGAAPTLSPMVESLLGKLKTKMETLFNLHRQSKNDVFEFHSGDIASFWMLNAICVGSSFLADLAQSKEQHPRRLFETMRFLAASLLAFSSRYTVADLPKYDHANPASHLVKLDRIIRDLVDTVISSKYFSILLVRDEQRSTHHRAPLDAARIDHATALYLAVSADMPAIELVASVPARFKIGAPDDVERIIVSSLSGLDLFHMAQVPPAIPVRPNTYYFSIGNKGALYENMLKAQTIAIYVPSGMKNLKLELFAVTQ